MKLRNQGRIISSIKYELKPALNEWLSGVQMKKFCKNETI